jgi:hypothetical protein
VELSPHVNMVRQWLDDEHGHHSYHSAILPVDYESQRGWNAMLPVW